MGTPTTPWVYEYLPQCECFDLAQQTFDVYVPSAPSQRYEADAEVHYETVCSVSPVGLFRAPPWIEWCWPMEWILAFQPDRDSRCLGAHYRYKPRALLAEEMRL